MNAHHKSEAAKEFWICVEQILIDKFGRDAGAAKRGIDKYKRAVAEYASEKQKVPEVVYNQGEETTAEVVNGVIETGVPVLAHRKRA